MNKNTLYITFDGLSDPLGQSQILPYLCGIAANGFQIHILSCEKKDRLEKEKSAIMAVIGKLPITWDYLFYDEQGGILSRLGYIFKIRKLALSYHKKKRIGLVHCRSYLASLIGLSLKLKHKVPFIFDMRGFWADERIDGGIWKKENFIQNFFYTYFKKKEKQFILQSDAIVSLTHAAVTELSKHHADSKFLGKTTVIPCCTDTALFSKEKAGQLVLPGLSPEDHLLIYTGSIGTWYYTKEMIDCILTWKEFIPEIKLLILTKDTGELNKILSAYSEEERSYFLSASASRKEVASYLAIAKASIFFIKPSYSKIASSPTKMAECWAMDLPIISNTGIGDNDLFFNNNKGGILINHFTTEDYFSACRNYMTLPPQNGEYRKIALENFDTKMAIEKYTAIYKSLTS